MATNSQLLSPILAALTASMSAKPRQAVIRRHEAMVRELKFLAAREDRNLLFIRTRRWDDEKLSVLFALNSVYQEVLGPLQASARAGVAGLGTQHAILHGSQRFDSAHSARVIKALEDFFGLVHELGFAREWLTKNTCGDLVFYIARDEHEDDAKDL